MCEPTTAMAALALASGVSQYLSADANYKAQVKGAQATKRNANKSYIQQSEAINKKQIQEQKSASNEAQEIRRQRLRGQGKAAASGKSVNFDLSSLEAEYLQQEGQYMSALNQNLEFKADQAEADKEALRLQADGRGVAAVNSVGAAPSVLGSVLSTASDVAGVYFMDGLKKEKAD